MPNWLLFTFSAVPIIFFTPLKPFIFLEPLDTHWDVLALPVPEKVKAGGSLQAFHPSQSHQH